MASESNRHTPHERGTEKQARVDTVTSRPSRPEQPSTVNRRILIISYLFPPMGGIGVQRALSLAKYLPRCGYEVHILTATNASGPVRDPDLVRQVPGEVKVHHAFTPEIPFAVRQRLWSRLVRSKSKPQPASPRPQGFSLKRLAAGTIKRVLCPEPEILWVPFALRQARQIIKHYRIEFVLVTVPPFSALVAGARLKREFPTVKLVSDFRDEWLSFYLKDFEFQDSDYTRRRAAAIERESVERSDVVVAVNHSSRDEIRRRYPDQPDAKFVVVPNGYDPEAFAGFAPRRHDSLRMVVTHVGTVYKTASPRFYMDALDALPGEIRDQFETRFIGRISDSERAQLESRNSAVQVVGFIPQSQALRYMEETDYLLLTMTNEISVPGKIFEYMATRKPILAVTPHGSEVYRMLEETGAGLSAPPDDAVAIRAMLTRAFEAWRTGTAIIQSNTDAVQRYERPRLAAEYSRVMLEIAGGDDGR